MTKKLNVRRAALKQFSARSVLNTALAQVDSPTANSSTVDPVSPEFMEDYTALKAQELEFEGLVARMTSWERSQWYRQHSPGKAESDPAVLKAFLELLKETRK